MNFQFATCDWSLAKGFIQQMYPSKEICDEEIPLLIALITDDVLRVQDPNFHQPCQIVGGTYYDNREHEVAAAIDQFKEAVHDKEPDNA